MMKIKKTFLTLLLLPALIFVSSCSDYSTPYGTYEFVMGSGSSKIGAVLQLKNEVHAKDPTKDQFEMQVFLGASSKSSSSSSSSSSGQTVNISGAWNLSNEKTKDGEKTVLNPDVYLWEQTPIQSEYIQYVLLMFYYGKTIDVIIPVSINDLEKRINSITKGGYSRFEIPESTSEYYYHTIKLTLSR